MGTRRWLLIAALIVVIAGGIGGYLYVRGDAPEEVGLSTTPPDGAGSFDGDFNGTWTIDNDSGSLEDGTSTFAGYRINEEFAGVGTNTAVGRTQDVSGEMTIDGTAINTVSVEVDMTTLRSDRDMRDNALRRRGLETEAYPTATFELTDAIEVGDAPETGGTIEKAASGELTIHGVTKEVEVSIQAKWTGETIEIAARYDVALADYDIEPPTTARVRSISDTGKLELHLLFAKP